MEHGTPALILALFLIQAGEDRTVSKHLCLQGRGPEEKRCWDYGAPAEAKCCIH